jgi:hypothetical protein
MMMGENTSYFGCTVLRGGREGGRKESERGKERRKDRIRGISKDRKMVKFTFTEGSAARL